MLHKLITYIIRHQLILVFFILVVGWVVYELRNILTAVFIAYIIMASLLPIVEYFKRKKFPRLLAVLIPYVGMISIIFLLIFPLIPFIISQVQSLFLNFPEYIDEAGRTLGFTINAAQVQDTATAGIGASSLMRTYPGVIYSYLKRNNKHTIFHNLGKRRSPVSWVIKEQLEKTISLNPNLITISVGANDIRIKNLPWRFEKQLRHLVRELKTKTKATIVINTLPDFTHTSWVPKLLKPVVSISIKQFNARIEKVSSEEGIVCVDLYHQANIFSEYPEATANDGFHPSDFGYALWANSIIAELRKTLTLHV